MRRPRPWHREHTYLLFAVLMYCTIGAHLILGRPTSAAATLPSLLIFAHQSVTSFRDRIRREQLRDGRVTW